MVPYRSAHFPGAVSEKIVPSGHDAHEHPAGTAEIARHRQRDGHIQRGGDQAQPVIRPRPAANRQQLPDPGAGRGQRIAAAQDTLDRTRITAPTSGRVLGLQVNTPGAVLGEGQVLAGIVPADSPLVVEVKVSPADINQVHQGGEARVRLTAYNYRTTPMVRGWLTHVSPDIFSDPKTGAPFYRAEITLDAAEMAPLPEVEMLAGMPAQVMIATGEQTLADYLLRPVLGGIEVALSENE